MTTVAVETRRRPLQRKELLLTLLSVPFLILILVPLASLIVKFTAAAAHHYIADSETAMAVSLSLGTSIASTLVVIALTTPLAILIARREFRGRNAVEVITELPI